MPYTGKHPGLVLAAGLALVLASALAPAGLRGLPVPFWSWLIWAATACAALAMFRQAGHGLVEGVRRLVWLAPVVLMFALPAALLVPGPHRALAAVALVSRALASAAAGASLAARLGPIGLVRAARQLGAPTRLADVLEATLSSLAIVLRQAQNMLRAREARRTSFGAWSDLATAPSDTVHGFGRLVAALLLRSLERAEAIEQARRARGYEP